MKDIYKIETSLFSRLKDETFEKINNSITIDTNQHVPFSYCFFNDNAPDEYIITNDKLDELAEYIESCVDKWYMDVIRLKIKDAEEDSYILDFWWIE